MPSSTQSRPDRSTAGEQELISLLRSRGQRVTSQRLVILRELSARRQHATADELRRSVLDDLPGISTPTVYATLELLVELGLARRIDAGAGAALYDGRREPHQHAVCDRCGTVEDLDGELDASELIRVAGSTGFRSQGAELVIHGVCAACAAREGDSAQAQSA
jgi:Fe2+ or Zn2+ uptake regulation protein